ncbi:MAG: glycosyltransferase family 39 protein, partial [Patescibacteria group bacterium]|nr:glycosyltransferase family 39 protein [Patescibacteria group bacterium]
MLSWIIRYRVSFLLIAIILGLAILRLHNVNAFNPYDGYDGGGHIDYIFSLAKQGRFPNIKTNNLAWHEPLYYLLQAAALKPFLLFSLTLNRQLKILGIMQTVYSLLAAAVIFFLARTTTRSLPVAALSTITLSLLPPFSEASTFITNELLSDLFIFCLLLLILRRFVEREPSLRDFLWLGILTGLALLAKMTAIVVVGPMILCFLWRARSAKIFRSWRSWSLLFAPMIGLFLPWFIYRSTVILPGPSINNTLFMQPAPLIPDQTRLHFYTWFDTDIFRFPFWYSGGR